MSSAFVMESDCSKGKEDLGPASGAFIPPDPELIAAGWQRRHLADENRAQEAQELYLSMGFEVKVQKLSPQDLGPSCGSCPSSSSVCGAYVMIYTRKKEK